VGWGVVEGASGGSSEVGDWEQAADRARLESEENDGVRRIDLSRVSSDEQGK
jgi:hypothetical protein